MNNMRMEELPSMRSIVKNVLLLLSFAGIFRMFSPVFAVCVYSVWAFLFQICGRFMRSKQFPFSVILVTPLMAFGFLRTMHMCYALTMGAFSGILGAIMVILLFQFPSHSKPVVLPNALCIGIVIYYGARMVVENYGSPIYFLFGFTSAFTYGNIFVGFVWQIIEEEQERMFRKLAEEVKREFYKSYLQKRKRGNEDQYQVRHDFMQDLDDEETYLEQRRFYSRGENRELYEQWIKDNYM